MKVEGQAEIKLFCIDYVEKATVRLLSIHYDIKLIKKFAFLVNRTFLEID